MNVDDQPWATATANILADWPDLAAPLVDALAAGRPTAAAVGKLTDAVAVRMTQVAQATALLTAHEAAGQGVEDPGGEPDDNRLVKLAGTFAGVIAAGYGSAAMQATLGVPLTEGPRLQAAKDAVTSAVRTALTALGTAVSGLVPTQVGAAMAAAGHEGRRAVTDAHPPLYLVADEHDDHAACLPCREIANTRYETLDDALEDYPTVGYRSCLGGIRCRGKLRSVWREPLTESSSSNLTEAAVAHSGAMIALVPSEADAARLAMDDGEPAAELHVTLAFLGRADGLDDATRRDLTDAVTNAFAATPVVEARLFAPSIFNPGSEDACLVLLAGGDMLDAAHHLLREKVPMPPGAADQHAPWHAHLTVRYDTDLLRSAAALVAIATRMAAGHIGSVRFDRVRLAFGDDIVDVPLVDHTSAAVQPVVEAERSGRVLLVETGQLRTF